MLDLAAVAIGVHIGTWHFDRKTDYNEVNLGAYVRMDRWQVGAYNNSHRKLSVYGAYAIPIAQRLSLHIGAASGYGHSVVPLLTLTYSFDAGPRVALIPSSPKGGSGGVHLAYELSRAAR